MGTDKRKYEATHPWITYRADLTKAPARLWLLLGEAISKCEHIAHVPLKPEVARTLNNIYLAKGIHATTAIEGNTLSEKEVLARIEGHLKLPKSKQYLEREVDNILRACNEVILNDLADGNDVRITPARIKMFNRLVLAGLDLEDDVIPGETRRNAVGVGHYPGAPVEDCEYLLERLCDFLSEPQVRGLEGASKAIVLAILGHLYVAWIHPFGDGNGRTARLLEFQLLVSAGVPVPAAHLLSDHYNQTRSEYYRQLNYASKSGGDILRFVMYAVQGFVDGLRSQIETIRLHQWDVAWENFVHGSFGDSKKRSAMDARRIRLVLDLSRARNPVPLDEIRTMSARVAEAYAGKGRKTLSRDLNLLQRRGLIEHTPAGYRALKEQMLSFLPLRQCSLIDEEPVPADENRGPVVRLGETEPEYGDTVPAVPLGG